MRRESEVLTCGTLGEDYDRTDSATIMVYYDSQIHLRRTINLFHDVQKESTDESKQSTLLTEENLNDCQYLILSSSIYNTNASRIGENLFQSR